MLKQTLAIAVLLTLNVPAIAQDSAVVWTGGIGTEDRATAPKEGTKLVFFVESGSFLSNVQVSVKDSSGREVVNAVSTGPWMILKLEPGRYSVRATVDGQAQGGQIDVTGGSQEFAYMFKAQ